MDAIRLESLRSNLSPSEMYPRNNFNHNIHLLSDNNLNSNFNRFNSQIPSRNNNNNNNNYLPSKTLKNQLKNFEALDEYINAPSIISNKNTRANSENDDTFNFPKKHQNQSSYPNIYNSTPYDYNNNYNRILSEPNYQPVYRNTMPNYNNNNNDNLLNPDEILPKIVPTSSPIETGYLNSEPSHQPINTNTNTVPNNKYNSYNNYTEPEREPADDTDSSFWEIPKERKEITIEINYPRNPSTLTQKSKPKKNKNKKKKQDPLVVNYTEPKEQEPEEEEKEEEPEIIVIPRKIKLPEDKRKKPKVYKLKPKTPSEKEEEPKKKSPKELFQIEDQENLKQTFIGSPKPKKKKERKKREKTKKRRRSKKSTN
jgi:hypothetical protein